MPQMRWIGWVQQTATLSSLDEKLYDNFRVAPHSAIDWRAGQQFRRISRVDLAIGAYQKVQRHP
jgi:hypothetical protein